MVALTRSENREYARVSTDLNVRLLCGEASSTCVAALARDLSTAGLGLEITSAGQDAAELLGACRERLDVELELSNGSPLRVPAELVWSRMEGTGDERVFTGGVRFLEVTYPERRKLTDFVKSKADERCRELRKTPRPR